MRYLGGPEGPTPRLHEVELEDSERVLREVLEGVEFLARAGVVHSDLSAFNVLMFAGTRWFIGFSDAIRVDRTGMAPWRRLREAKAALDRGMHALQVYFRRYELTVQAGSVPERVLEILDRFGVLS